METSQEQIIQQVYDYTVKRLVLDKASTETAKDELTEQSVNEEIAILRGVIEKNRKYIDSDDTEIAGKTSTTITSKGKEVSFCGYFTVDGSIYTCLVIISNPKQGYPSGGGWPGM